MTQADDDMVCRGNVIVSDHPAVIEHDFVIHICIRCWLPLILIVLSRQDRGIQSLTEMLPLKRGAVLHVVLTHPQFGRYVSC